MNEIIYGDECYIIVGLCMEIHNHLGHGFSEIVYKDALQYELIEHNIIYEREKEYSVLYKRKLLPHKFFADFVIFDAIIVEIKCVNTILDEHVAQAINYLKVSGKNLALLINFKRGKLEYKRILY